MFGTSLRPVFRPLLSSLLALIITTAATNLLAADRPSLDTIITTLEKQREQVKSLDIETKSYCTTHVAPHVLQTWRSFSGTDFTFQDEYHFAYKGGKRYLQTIQTTRKRPGGEKGLGTRRVLYHDKYERGDNGKQTWERRVTLERGPAHVFVNPHDPGGQWIQNPEYCSNIGWDCKTELNIHDESVLKRHRTHDLLSLLKKGAFTLEPGTTEIGGTKCVSLQRTYQQKIMTRDRSEKPLVASMVQVTETIWLDVDHGFAVRQRERNTYGRLDRTVNSDFVEILPGIWFPKKTETQAHAPPEAAPEYQGRAVLSWNVDLIRWSVNDVLDNRFDILTKPSDVLLIKKNSVNEKAEIKIVDDSNQAIDPTSSVRKPNSTDRYRNSSFKTTPEALTTEEKRLVDLLAKAGAAEKPDKAQLRVAIASGAGCSPTEALIDLLKSHSQFQCKFVTLEEIGQGALKSYDVVVFPGGKATRQGKGLGKPGRSAVREFVKTGGGYVGVCAGAALATSNNDSYLGLVNAKVLSTKKQSPGPDGVMTIDMGRRGGGILKMELTDVGQKILTGRAGLMDTVFLAGPVLLPAGRADLPRCLCLGFYRTEVWLHKLHLGTMIDTPNILASRYGKGRVIIFSAHPEEHSETAPTLVRAVQSTAPKPADTE